MNEVNAMSNE
jgi:26S proteasome regulatory subunit T5